MISKTQIRYMANSSSYSKGAELYATGKVLDMDVKNMGASDEIVASVKGSGRNIYEVDVSIDTENDEVDTCYCECRAYAEYCRRTTRRWSGRWGPSGGKVLRTR